MNVGAYLENGDIKMMDLVDIHSDTWRILDQGFRIEGKLITIVSDWRDMASHYVLTMDKG